jgi:hypothetical protein
MLSRRGWVRLLLHPSLRLSKIFGYDEEREFVVVMM